MIGPLRQVVVETGCRGKFWVSDTGYGHLVPEELYHELEVAAERLWRVLEAVESFEYVHPYGPHLSEVPGERHPGQSAADQAQRWARAVAGAMSTFTESYDRLR